MPIVAAAFAFASVTSLAMYFLGIKREPSVKDRLEQIADLGRVPTEREQELSRPLVERIFGPVATKVAGFVVSITPKNVMEAAKLKLDSIGNPWKMSAGDYVILRVVTLLILPLGVFLITNKIGLGKAFLFALVAAALGWVVPETMMQSKAKHRGKEIQRDLPDILDLLTVSVEAGLGFDAALVKVVERKKGPLADEFGIVLREIRVGKPRKDALRELSERVTVDDITSLVSAVIQADQLGVGISNILRIQAEQVRTKRRQQAEEAAMKAPIKMLFPLVFFIFPTLFVVLLGPAIIQIAETLLGF
ncbi:MAG TPA: type II secretion system F family protein [Firmicutes bacterium]|jgi:tight adherence protein C|nr:type II secretion system F family protein [Bacillota bacterium]